MLLSNQPLLIHKTLKYIMSSSWSSRHMHLSLLFPVDLNYATLLSCNIFPVLCHLFFSAVVIFCVLHFFYMCAYISFLVICSIHFMYLLSTDLNEFISRHKEVNELKHRKSYNTNTHAYAHIYMVPEKVMSADLR